MKEKINWSIRKKVLPQHADNAGVMWHGCYMNWLEEARIDALSKSGVNYSEISNKGYELPVIEINIKYILPVYLGEEILIESKFNVIDKSLRINNFRSMFSIN